MSYLEIGECGLLLLLNKKGDFLGNYNLNFVISYYIEMLISKYLHFLTIFELISIEKMFIENLCF